MIEEALPGHLNQLAGGLATIVAKFITVFTFYYK